MKAYRLHDINELCFEEVECPQPKSGEVLVEVKSAGICGSDIPRIFYTGTYSYPLIPGHEFSGMVVKMGDNVNRSWINKRVGVFPLIPCMDCGSCRDGHYEMCRRYSYLGSRTNGGFAEYVVVPEWNLIEISKEVSYDAAAMLEPMAVAIHAMRYVMPKKDDYVVVCGLGTIGTLLTMFLKEAGINNLLVIGNKDFQKNTIVNMGVSKESYCDSRNQNISNWIRERTNGLGADVFFECVGKNETITLSVECTTPGGSVQLIGNPASDMMFDKSTYWKILRNQLTIKGSWNSSFNHRLDDDWHYVLRRLEQGKIHPEKYITQRIRFEELKEGLYIMKDKTDEYIKIMITNQ